MGNDVSSQKCSMDIAANQQSFASPRRWVDVFASCPRSTCHGCHALCAFQRPFGGATMMSVSDRVDELSVSVCSDTLVCLGSPEKDAFMCSS